MAKVRYSRISARKSPSSTLILTLLLTFTFVILILLALGILSIPSTSSSDSSRKANDLSSIAHNSKIHESGDDEGKAEQWVERDGKGFEIWTAGLEFESGRAPLVRVWDSRNFIRLPGPTKCAFRGWGFLESKNKFLTKAECDYLINLAKPHMQKSMVVDSSSGKSKDSRVRTSSGTFLPRGRDKIIRDIEKRIADFSFIPAEHGEGLQILHYEVGQKYEPHFDYFMDDYNTENGGQRIATVLMYLSDVEEGGETVFPSAKGNISSVPWWNELSECGKGGLSVKPKMGDALLFWSMKPDASLDPSSFHGGCPVIRGNKWSSTKWMRVNEYKV